IAWRLSQPHLRRALFDYLSFATLTGLGYADITPLGPPADSLSWLEVLFGQFYMAAVVAQPGGLQLATAVKGDGAGSKSGPIGTIAHAARATGALVAPSASDPHIDGGVVDIHDRAGSGLPARDPACPS